ncbi:MAG TPA: NAD-dependent epimerase/dehydratase family protein [Dehalococcoidia bacterium]|nr:NAD-dependent epimerase/dehydratase family protein [Dehalococcoidia bacterium]
MTLALVTGATGFIGTHVVRALRNEGVSVRALVRPETSAARLADEAVEVVPGNVTEPPSVIAAMADVDVVFHLAAHYGLTSAAAQQIAAVNVEGTRTVMQAAMTEGVQLVVHTSSVAAVGHTDAAGAPATEATWTDPREFAGPYEASKYDSERIVQRMIARDGLRAIVVNPTAPIGPLDVKPTPTGQMILDAARGTMPGYLAGAGLNIVHVRDVAMGHLLAWQRGQIGARYILGNQDGNLTLQQILERAAAAAGRSGPRLRIPYAAALAYAHLDERILSRFQDRPVRAPIAGVRLAKHRMWFDCTRAVTELGLPQTPLEDAFSDAVQSFIDRGLVRRPEV